MAVILQNRREVRDAIDEGLRDRYATTRQVLAGASADDLAGSGAARLLPRGESFGQVLANDGSVLAASPRGIAGTSLLQPATLASARRQQVIVETDGVPPSGEPARLLAGPAGAVGPDGRALVVVVGTRLAETRRADDRLVLALVVGLSVLAGLVSVGGWILVGAALAPVQSMIDEADEISLRRSGDRLTVPEGAGLELEELATRLNEMLARIESSLEHERAFLDDASHELRTPLAILRGETELARMNVADGSDTATSLDSVLEEVSRLQRLTEDLLVLARTRAGAGARADIDLAAVAATAVDALDRSGRLGAVTVTCTGAASVVGDPAALERALVNVIENAVRHAQAHVVVTLVEAHGDAIVEVLDDGPGFPEGLVGRRAFERFAHGDGAGRGAGLGLAIVDAIVAAHGGRAEALNADGGGGIVRLALPMGGDGPVGS